jgi:protein-tyrosine phosphatase
MLRQGVRRVLAAFDRDERVLLHCQFGIGRSPLLACCVLIGLGNNPRDALVIAKRARPVVSPSPEQLHALLAFARRRCRRDGQSPAATTWHDLAAVAYINSPAGSPESRRP